MRRRWPHDGTGREPRKQHREQPSARPSRPRLLPRPTPAGRPCYRITDNSRSYLSRLTDGLEATQLATGVDTLGRARRVLDDPMSPYTDAPKDRGKLEVPVGGRIESEPYTSAYPPCACPRCTALQ
ncbi:hypothetical protein [Streptomyces sasae]|uniref:hypothetical protein n=1 Tax=Streptomyces sasae TaxID=1266772 RepID=UPI002931936D|nr:hypothetical protein [Streptomyces sasae]